MTPSLKSEIEAARRRHDMRALALSNDERWKKPTQAAHQSIT
jgi:hypothetical protein